MYQTLAADSAEVRGRLARLAEAVAALEAIRVPAVTGGSRVPVTGGSVPRTGGGTVRTGGSAVVLAPAPVVTKPATIATTGASGKP